MKKLEVRFEGQLPAPPQEVWDAFTVHTTGWYWDTPEFLGVRSADALYRFYGRDAWCWPVGVAHHLFADGVPRSARGRPGASGWMPCSSNKERSADAPVRSHDVRARIGGGGPPAEVLEAHGALPGRVAEAGGRIVGGMALEPPSTATSIRGDVVTDGPFVETKEVLGGIFVLEARDLDHALALAKMTPIVDGGVEVRPLLGFEVVDG